MYRFNMKEPLPCTAREVFERTLSNFDEYAKFTPNVTRAEVLSREKTGENREKITVRVFAEGWLPPLARAIFNQKEVDWKEFYDVDKEKLTADWKVETPMFTEYIDCKGTSSCHDAPGGSEVIITGAMSIGLPPIKGVPVQLVRTIFSTIEPFIGKMVITNMKKYFYNIRRCMVEEKNRGGN